MSPPIQNNIVSSDDDDNDGVVDTVAVAVIENISTINDAITYTDNNNANGEQPHEVAQDDEDDGTSLSLSSATSATSVASTLSDGVPRPRTRSASLSILSSTAGRSDGASRTNSAPRQRSTPRSRPRSNPQTR